MKNLINKNTKNNITKHLLAVAIVGIMTSLILVSAISEVTAKPVPHFATPNSMTVAVKPALSQVSLSQNVQQRVTSTVNDEFGAPVANVKLDITVTTPSGSQTFNRTTGPDGTDRLIIPLSATGSYTASVIAHNPNPGVGDAQGSTSWTVSQ